MEKRKQHKTFLVVEDNPDDAALIRRAFAALESCQAFVCRNLSEAKAYLQGSGMYQMRDQYPFPNAVVCDYRLGGESGVDLVKWLKSHAEFQNLPVIVLSGGASDKEMLAAKKLGAIETMRKPARFEDLQAMLTDLAGKLCS